MESRARLSGEEMRTRSGTHRRSPLWPALAAVVLTACIAGAYADSFQGAFVFDDLWAIRDNKGIRQSLWEAARSITHRPVVGATFWLNYSLHGLEVWGYHAFNMSVHVLGALALMGIVRRTLLLPIFRGRFAGSARALALAVATLWGVHPLQTEAVTYLWQRCESLMGLLYLLCLYCFIRGAQSSRAVAWYAASVLACLLGLGTKTTIVTAPFTVLAYDRVFLSESWKVLLRRRWAVHACLLGSLGMVAATVFALAGQTGVVGTRYDAGSSLSGLTRWMYARSQFGVIVHYLRLSFWPDELCLDYVWQVAKTPMDIWPHAAVIGAMLLATLVGLWRRSGWGFLGLWFFLALAPRSSVIASMDLAVEHRMYVPLAGVVSAGVLGVYMAGRRLLLKLHVSEGARKNWGWGLSIAALVAGVGALGYRTSLRNRDYRSELAIWQETVRVRPQNPRAHYSLGCSLARNEDSRGAIAAFSKTIEICPSYVDAYNNRGTEYSRLGSHDLAVRDYTIAIFLKPGLAVAYYNRGNAYVAQGKLSEAIADYTKTLELNPDYHNAYNNRGIACYTRGEYPRAAEDFTRALQCNPTYPDGYNNRAMARVKLGLYDQAIRDYDEAIRLNPRDADLFANRGIACANVGRHDLAVRDYSRAIELNPRCQPAYANRVVSYLSLKDYDNAWKDVKACRSMGAALPQEYVEALIRASGRTE